MVIQQASLCCKRGWRLALCGRCHLITEVGYATVEGGVLAVAWHLSKARLLLLGCPNLVMATDHQPLIKHFCHKALKDIVNPHLSCFKEQTRQYRVTIRCLRRKSNAAADFLSRYPVVKSSQDAVDEEEDITAS